jgi:hypothetical protein
MSTATSARSAQRPRAASPGTPTTAATARRPNGGRRPRRARGAAPPCWTPAKRARVALPGTAQPRHRLHPPRARARQGALHPPAAQPRLADPRRPLHEHGRAGASARSLQHLRERVELAPTLDHRRAGTDRHASILGRGGHRARPRRYAARHGGRSHRSWHGDRWDLAALPERAGQRQLSAQPARMPDSLPPKTMHSGTTARASSPRWKNEAT